MSSPPTLRDPYFVAAILGTAAILLVTLLLPLGFDNDVYQSMAWTLYAYHGLPYLASWDMNFPGIVFVHWASIALFGSSDFGFRLFDYFIQIAFAALYFRLLRQWLSPAECLTSVIVYALCYTHGSWGMYGQRDAFAVVFLVASAILLFHMRQHGAREWSAIILGLLSSSAILIRPTYGLFAIAVLILLMDLHANWKCMASYVLGHIVLWTAVLLPYTLTSGGLSQFFHSTISFNVDIYSRIKVGNGIYSGTNAAFWILALFGLVLRARSTTRNGARPMGRFDRKFLLLFAVCSVLSPVVMGKYFTYHLLAAQTIIIPLASLGFLKIINYVQGANQRRGAIAATFVVLLFLLYPRHLFQYYFNGLRSPNPLHSTYSKVLSDSLFGLDAQEEATRYLNARLKPTATVEFATLFPGLKWRLRYPSATRFTTLVPLARTVQVSPDYVEAWRREFIDSIRSARPAYIILSRSHEWWPFVNAYADSVVHQIPGFDDELARDYEFDTILRGFELYRLRP